jgi:hypothetical protein
MGTYPAAMLENSGAPSRLLFNLIEIVLPASPSLPAQTIRLVNGSGVIQALGASWVGQDGDYGSWRGCTALDEQVLIQSPKISITLTALTDEAQQQLGQPASQLAPVTLYTGELNQTTGLPIVDPELVFAGKLDIGTITVGQNSRTIVFDVMAASELMFINNDGSTLNGSWHNEFFPGETGFQFVDYIDHQVPWGAAFDTDQGGGVTNLRF